MSADTFSKVDEMKAAIEADQPGDLQALEQFRIKYLGSKTSLRHYLGKSEISRTNRKKSTGSGSMP